MLMRILVSGAGAGAGVAGPVLAYWLTRQGFAVTVVERAPALRKTGGHAVDLFRPAMNISAKMGVLPRVEERATGTSRMTLHPEGARRPSGWTSPRSSATSPASAPSSGPTSGC
ncbi:FAD-dependent monooxygenase [Nonomuraea sp. NPDC050643]|uniref:FAD-dependent monooxygenase n=1 Tax=Nonomuraea sp. NPDC050643 TaxID=3155660 RepID=UPI0033F1EF1D